MTPERRAQIVRPAPEEVLTEGSHTWVSPRLYRSIARMVDAGAISVRCGQRQGSIFVVVHVERCA